MFQCKICNYFSNRKYNLQRHYDNKHTKQVENNENTQNEQNVSPNIQNDIPKIQNDIPKIQNDISKTQNDIPSEVKVFICKTCNKIYKTKRHLLNHEKRCQKVDNLTCPKCMASFTHRNNKNRHIKENKCVARSIVHARRPYIQNITNNTNNTNNTINNIQNTNITNHNQIIMTSGLQGESQGVLQAQAHDDATCPNLDNMKKLKSEVKRLRQELVLKPNKSKDDSEDGFTDEEQMAFQ